MRFEETFDFDCHADILIRMFGNERFYHEKYRRMKSSSPEFLDAQKTETRFSITMRHHLLSSTFSLPELARKRLGEHVELKQTDTWDLSTREGNISIQTASVPVQADIGLRLLDREAGAQLILEFDVRAKLPILAQKVEKAVASGLVRRMRTELQETVCMIPEYT